MSKDFDEILDTCLERMRKGEKLEDCLASYPDQAGELAPLLRTALFAEEASSLVPRPETQQASRSRFLTALAEKRGKKHQRISSLVFWQRRWAMAMALAVAFVLLAGGAGTVAASTGSIPGDTLYPVKTAAERVQAFFTFGNEAKANLRLKLAERRAEEIKVLAEENRPISRAVLTIMNGETKEALRLISQSGLTRQEVVARLVRVTSNQKEVLAEILEEAPPDLKLRIIQALREATKAYEDAVSIQKNMPEAHNLQRDPTISSNLESRLPTFRVTDSGWQSEESVDFSRAY